MELGGAGWRWMEVSGRFSNTLFLRYTDADLKISVHVCIHIKAVPFIFCIYNPKNFRVIHV